MAHKVIVPQKKNYVPKFLKQRDIGNFMYQSAVGCYRGLLVAVCEQVLRGGRWLVARAPPPHHYSLGIHGCMLVGGYYSYIWPLPDGQLINTHYWRLRSHHCSNDSYRFSLSMRIEYAFSLRVQPLVVCIHKGGGLLDWYSCSWRTIGGGYWDIMAYIISL